MDKTTTTTKLLRVSWEAVPKIVTDVVADTIDEARLEGLYRIGVDEISYRKVHRYLTVVADHDCQVAVVWAGGCKDHRPKPAHPRWPGARNVVPGGWWPQDLLYRAAQAEYRLPGEPDVSPDQLRFTVERRLSPLRTKSPHDCQAPSREVVAVDCPGEGRGRVVI